MLDAYLWYCDLERPLRAALEDLVSELDDEWGLLLRMILDQPLAPLPEWLDPADRAVAGRLQYCLLSGDDVYPLP